MTSRSAPENWLLGKSDSQLTTARLPRNLDVLRLLKFYHIDEGRTIPASYKLACEAVSTVWERAKIPTQRIDSCVRKLSKIHNKYVSLKKNRTRKRESDRMNEEMFKGDLEELFDIAMDDAMKDMKNEEDREFLQKQRVDVFSWSMSGTDEVCVAKESRKRKRNKQDMSMEDRYKERESSTRQTAELSSASSGVESQSEDDYQPPVSAEADTRPDDAPTTPKRPTNSIFSSPEVASALDRINLPDRGAVFVAGAIAKALGHDLSESTLSRSSIRRSRRKGRREAAAAEMQEASSDEPLLLHWDGKLLPDIDRSKATVDRIAVLVTGNGHEKLLGIPKMEHGTGESQAQACTDAIQKWNLRPQIKGLVFDTTASNTGLRSGACIRIEESLGTELVWIACRHHVMEVILSHVFSCIFGPTSSPETGFFKRFQKEWSSINQGAYTVATEELFNEPVLRRMREEMLVYLPHALEVQQPRDDYQEFLRLSLLFLGGVDGNTSFRAPGPTHHARWMGRGIYALKIFLFKDQFKLTPRESRNITDLAMFVSLIYIRQWNEAPLGIRAPYNDIELLSVLNTYPNKSVASKASKAFCRHLWFLSEHLVALSFFDDRVSTDTKEKMVQNLQRPKLPVLPRRLQIANAEEHLKLEDFVTKRTSSFFDLLMKRGKERSQSFLEKPIREWTDDPLFNELRDRCSRLKVVNDTAERGISLIQKYNDTLTKDEEQKQYLLRLVANHRKMLPSPSKAAVM